MNEDFWIKISKSGIFYIVEKWQAGEDRIVYVEKRKTFTRVGAMHHARRCIIKYISKKYIIKENK